MKKFEYICTLIVKKTKKLLINYYYLSNLVDKFIENFKMLYNAYEDFDIEINKDRLGSWTGIEGRHLNINQTRYLQRHKKDLATSFFNHNRQKGKP